MEEKMERPGKQERKDKKEKQKKYKKKKERKKERNKERKKERKRSCGDRQLQIGIFGMQERRAEKIRLGSTQKWETEICSGGEGGGGG